MGYYQFQWMQSVLKITQVPFWIVLLKIFFNFFFSDKWEIISDPSFSCSHLKKDSDYEQYITLFKYPIVPVQKSGMSYCFKSSQYVFLMTTLVRDNISTMHFSSETLVRMFSVQHLFWLVLEFVIFSYHFKSNVHFPLSVIRTIFNDFIKNSKLIT